MTSYVPPAKYPPALMTRAAISPRFHSRSGASRSARWAGSGSRSAVTSAAARRVVDGASGGNWVESGAGAGWVRTLVSLARRAIGMAASHAAIPLKTNTNAMPPNQWAPKPPIAGPSSSPPICTAPYRPNASPRRSGGVASVR